MTAQLNTANYIVNTSPSKIDAAITLLDSHIKKMTESSLSHHLKSGSPPYAYDLAFKLLVQEDKLNQDQLFTLARSIFSNEHLNSNPAFCIAARWMIDKNKFNNEQLHTLLNECIHNSIQSGLNIRYIIRSTTDARLAKMANKHLLNLKKEVKIQYEPQGLNPEKYASYFSEVERENKGGSLNYDHVNIGLLDVETQKSIMNSLKTNKVIDIECMYGIPIPFAEEILEHFSGNNKVIVHTLNNVNLGDNPNTLNFISNNTIAKERLSQLAYGNETAKSAIKQILSITKESQKNATLNSLICSKDAVSNNLLLDYAIDKKYLNVWARNNDIDKNSLREIYEKASREEFKDVLSVVFERAFEFKFQPELTLEPSPSAYIRSEDKIILCSNFIANLLATKKIDPLEALTLWPPVIVTDEALARDALSEKISGIPIPSMARCFIVTVSKLINSISLNDFINTDHGTKKSILALALSRLNKDYLNLDFPKITADIYSHHNNNLKVDNFYELKKLKSIFTKDALASTGLSLMCFLANGKIKMSPKEIHDVTTTVAGIVTRIDSSDTYIGGTQFINYLCTAISSGVIGKDLAISLNDSLIKALKKLPLSKINYNTDIINNSNPGNSKENKYLAIIENEITAAILKLKVKEFSEIGSNTLMTKQHKNRI